MIDFCVYDGKVDTNLENTDHTIKLCPICSIVNRYDTSCFSMYCFNNNKL